jgi:hypothetical protein
VTGKHLFIAFALFAVVLLFSIPASPWEFDETLFFQGLHRYDPVAHHPPPPGYPVFMGVGKIARAVMPSDFSALVAVSVLASLAGFVMLALAIRNFTGDPATGIAGATLFYFSPAMLVHAPLPISDPGAVALLAATLLFLSRGSAGLFAFFAALTVGWRIQFSIFVVPLFLLSLFFFRRWRDRGGALVIFTLVCLAWLMPLAAAVGGLEELVKFETGQGKYLAAHDAAQSRSGWTPPMLALRFVAHPWGVKVASFPILLAAVAGAILAFRERRMLLAPAAVAAAGYLGFALWTMDPADGVRYAMPVTLTTSLFAAIGAIYAARRMSIPPFVLPALFAAASLVYVSSLIAQRRSTISPPVAAAMYARKQFPRGAVATYELPLWPHATYYLRDFTPRRFDGAMDLYFERPDVPMFLYADGGSLLPGAVTFAWAPSDAYSKLTRNHYRVASIIPLPPETRFRAIRGIYGWEREPAGLAWRWIAEEAELQLPKGPSRKVYLELGLPADSAIASNEVTIAVDGQTAGTWRVDRGGVTAIGIDVTGGPIIRLTPKTTFVPAQIGGSLSRDPRTLSVKLLTLRAAAAPAIAVPKERPDASPRSAPPAERRPAASAP